MLHSMTGFGKGRAGNERAQAEVEIRSVNHRYLSLKMRLPSRLNALEHRIRKRIEEEVTRGRLDIRVSLEENGGTNQSLEVDRGLALAYYNNLKALARELNVVFDFDINSLIHLPDFVTVKEEEEDPESYWKPVARALDAALERLLEMRAAEGEKLAEEMAQRCFDIRASLETIDSLSDQVEAKIKERLREKVERMLSDDVSVDDEKLENEIVYHADKADITEEIVRLESHLEQFLKELQAEKGEGPRLKFLLQEMHREANTIGSKTPLAEVKEHVVEIKTEIEKLREQVRNVE